MGIRSWLALALVAGLYFGHVVESRAGAVPVGPPPLHVTDGNFTSPAEWDDSGTDPTRNVQSHVFPFDAATGQGGSEIYVEGTGSTLWLMYDVFSIPKSAFDTSTGFFDIFFQSKSLPPSSGGVSTALSVVGGGGPPPSPIDYLIRVTDGLNHFQAFDKPDGVLAPVDGAGNFLPNQNPWTPVDPNVSAVNFHTALAFNASDGNPDHLMVEFDVSNRTTAGPNGGNPNGVYDPSPAFWSAGDGTVSSETFTLTPDGKLLSANPDVGPNGDPLKQSPVPEPSTFVMLLGMGAASLFAFKSRRNRRSDLPQ